MLSYLLPDKESCVYPLVISSTGTVQDTAKSTIDLVSMDRKVSQ